MFYLENVSSNCTLMVFFQDMWLVRRVEKGPGLF